MQALENKTYVILCNEVKQLLYIDNLSICSSSPDPLIVAVTAQKALDHLKEWSSL